MRLRRSIDSLVTRAYMLEHGTNPQYVAIRKSNNFIDLAMTALNEIAPRGYHAETPLDVIYTDLLDAHWIANTARPITMPAKTFGQWVRWYEINVIPTLPKLDEPKA